MKPHLETRQSPLRAWVIGALLIPVNCYWLIQMEEVRRAAGATVFSLFFNALFTLWALFLLNEGLRRFASRIALDNRELLTVYIMVNMVTALCSYGMLPILLPVMTYAFWGATPENEWRSLFHRDVASWLTIDEPKVLIEYYRGGGSLYSAWNLEAWLSPLLWWSLFTLVLIFVMVCINVIVSKQWIEREKLSYPIAEIPLNLVHTHFYNRLMWVGFAIAVGINLINGVHMLYPQVPELIFFKRQYIGYIFTDKPWNALRAMRIAFIPSIIGLSFFMPLDLLFSCWFFYFYWQGMRILGVALGWQTYPAYGRHAYIVQESVGAYLAILAFALWRGRRHFLQTLKPRTEGAQEDTPMPYTVAWGGIICGTGLLIIFGYQAGMSLRVASAFFIFFFTLSTAITRLRAEIGFPDHDAHFCGPIQMITSALGSANLSQRTKVAMPLFWFISRRFDNHIMPHQLEGFKIASRSRMNQRNMLWSILFGSAIGIIATFWLLLDTNYRYGLDNMPYPSLYWAREPWSYLQEWLRSPTEIDYYHIALIGLGVIIATALACMRTLFVWWPLHPVGYAVAGSYGMSFLWSCMLASWVFKWLILRHGGLRAYRRAMPLFLGLVFGEFAMTSVWTIIGIAFNLPRVYQFWI